MSDLFSVKGKAAVVTGGSRGIGLMIAHGLVDAGARVYISSRKAGVCDEVAAELSKNGECYSIPADLGTLEGLDHLAGRLSEREQALHILVNNAGATWGASLETYPDEAFDKIWAVNVKAMFHLTVKCLPLLRKAAADGDPARVINVGSIDGIRVPYFENYAYSASKAAVHMLTRHMAHTLHKENITVNAIAPGFFPTKMTKGVMENAGAEIIDRAPLKRVGGPEDLKGLVALFASDAGAFITGQVVAVDGGVTAV